MTLSKRDFDGLKRKVKRYSVADGGGLNIRVQPDGRKILFLQYRTKAGRQRKLTFGEITLLEARKLALAAKAKIAQGLDPQEEIKLERVNQMSFGEFLVGKYRPYLEANHANPKASLWVLEKCFERLKKVPLCELTLNHVQQWTNKNKHLAPATVNRRVGALRACLEKARLWGFISNNPIADWKKMRVRKEPVRFLAETEVQELFEVLSLRDRSKRAARVSFNRWRQVRQQELLPDYDELEILFSDYLTPLVLLILDTGLRFGEAISLRWADINDSVITARSSKTESFRYVPLTSDCQTMLAQLKVLNEAVCGGPTSHVFVNEKGLPLRSVKTAWNNVRRELGFDCDFRMLRRTFGSRLIGKGVPVYHVSQMLGHSNVQTTQRWYLSLDLNAYKDAIAVIDRFLGV